MFTGEEEKTNLSHCVKKTNVAMPTLFDVDVGLRTTKTYKVELNRGLGEKKK